MAEAVSWQAGAMRRVSAKAGSSARGPVSVPMAGAGIDELGCGDERGVERREDLRRPLSVEVEHLGVAGVGAFGDRATAQTVEDVFGEVEPGETAQVGDCRRRTGRRC